MAETVVSSPPLMADWRQFCLAPAVSTLTEDDLIDALASTPVRSINAFDHTH